MSESKAQKIKYESFIYKAFSLALGEKVGRRGDPGHLADADHFVDDKLDRIKAGVAYAIEVYNVYIMNNDIDLSISDYELSYQIQSDVIKANNKDEVVLKIEEYNKILEKYKLL
ncbi:hypothetical protein [Paenibacillus pinihumi]|uniref:hypothetical protein n=1 Tax=Paenibacillus pinihumi TaxID=669462 RepID=UPI00041BC967|nr:hypothetical protein [Paenibacillus pinihumi]